MPGFRYSWRRCTLGRDDAFIGIDSVLKFGGISLVQHGPSQGLWDWSLNGQHFPGYVIKGYMDASAREVAAHVEAEYDRLLPLADGLHLRCEAEVAFYEERGLPMPLLVQWRKAVLVDHTMTMDEANAHFRPDFKPSTLNTTHSRRSRR